MEDNEQNGEQQNETENGAGQNSGDQQNAETREAAAAAGGYNLGSGASSPAPDTDDDTATNLTQPDLSGAGAADGGDVDDGRITNQEAREGAGPFTGTGNQDALRTAGRAGASDAHHADQRTSGDESAVEGQSGEGAEGGEESEDDGAA